MLKRVIQERSANLLARCMQRIRQSDADIQAWVRIDPQPPLADGPLIGVPFGAKDIFETEALPTELGSPLYQGRVTGRDAAVVRRLRTLGAILLGKTHTAAFAYIDPAPTRNPHNLEHTPGGSSSGSAAAVAAGMVPFALGTQTRGSVIRPAAYCGITGFKPTHDLLPLDGVLMVSRSLDTVGMFTQTAEDMSLLWRVLGFAVDDGDTPAIGVAQPVPEVEPEMAQTFLRTVSLLRDAGLAMHEIDLPASFLKLHDAGNVIMFYEGAKEHEPRFREHGARLGQFAALIEHGLSVEPEQYRRARKIVDQAREQMSEVFQRTPLILTPATLGPAPRGLASTGDPRMNAPWTTLGTPTITIPMPVEHGLPLGLQIAADRGQDALLLGAAERLSQYLLRAFPRSSV